MFEELTSFQQRVETAVFTGMKLNKREAELVKEIVSNYIKEVKIYSSALAYLFRDSLESGKIGREEFNKFFNILEKAKNRVEESKPPFSKEEEEVIRAIFKDIGLDRKAANRFLLGFSTLKAKTLLRALEPLRQKGITNKKPTEERIKQ